MSPVTAHSRFAITISAIWLAAGAKNTWAAATCAFDPASATVTVTATGGAVRLRAIRATGEIRVNDEPCAGATVNNTDTITVTDPGTGRDHLTVSGRFQPGLTAESDGASEIEIAISLGAALDSTLIELTRGNDRLTFSSAGIDVGGDLDTDITVSSAETLEIDGLEGDDIINASAYAGTPAFGAWLNLYGGEGNDRLVGDAQRNMLFGGAGEDALFGGEESDWLYGGPGNDALIAGSGNDRFYSEAIADGADSMNGGAGVDTVYYDLRANGVAVTLDNGLADDGEPGEADSIDLSVEDVVGGSGDDLLVGSGKANDLRGGPGDDEIYGGDRGDFLVGDDGVDSVFGEAGDDRVIGGDGADLLTGGEGNDYFEGNGGDDTMFNGGEGSDSVSCGSGTDDAEPDPLDTFNGCEL